MEPRQKLAAKSAKHPHAFYAFDTDEPAQALGKELRQKDYELWSALVPAADEDYHLAVAELQRVTAKPEKTVESAISAFTRIQQLPFLKTLQETTHWLDFPRLVAIDEALMRTTNEHVVAEIDEMLALSLIPRHQHQNFPTAAQIRRRINDWMRTLAPELDLDKPEPKKTEMWVDHTHDGRTRIDIESDTTVGARIEGIIKKHMKAHHLTPGEALEDLLSRNTSTKVVLNLYQAKDVPNAPVYLFGVGWLASAALEEFVIDAVRNVDDEGKKETTAYQTPPGIRAFVAGRDGCCRFPGCGRRADQAQMDHVTEYDETGHTRACDLISLCQHHHNMKTDRRIRPILLANGDVVWLFENGTWQITEAEGPLAPKNRNWVQTVGQRIANRRSRNAADEKPEDPPADTNDQQEDPPF